jgi:hypothetical protein
MLPSLDGHAVVLVVFALGQTEHVRRGQPGS